VTVNKISKGHNLRWESSRMMLPEHVEQFIEYRNNIGKITKPILEEQKLEEINDILRIAIEDYTPINLDLFCDGKIRTVHCYVNKYDLHLKELKVTLENETQKIKLDCIVDARIM